MSMAVKGVDISDNNGAVDFEALKAAGVEFVLIRCGYGSDYADQDDGEFFANVRKAKEAGIPYGAYLYSYALNTAQAESEAAHALRLLRQVDKPAYGIWFDMEDADGYKQRKGTPSNDTLAQICGVFCKKLEAAGYYCGIYASLSWLENQLDDPRLDRYDKWVAQWNSNCEYRKPYGIWQFTDRLAIGGKVFDGNWAYKDYPALTGKKKEDEGMLSYEQFQEYMKRYEAETAGKAVSSWAQEAVEYCKENGIMNGDADGKFRPQAPITRQEMAIVAMNLHKRQM